MRKIVHYGFTAETDLDLSHFDADIGAWFAAQPTVGEPAWLLAYAEDGVIWGKLTAGNLILQKTGNFTLSAQTLLEARLFGAKAEIHVWRRNDRFNACRVTDVKKENGAFDEWQRLWGTEIDTAKENNPGVGFTRLVEGRHGLRHTVPLEVPNERFARNSLRYHPVFLCTRHYFGVDQATGATSVAMSRLVCLDTESKKEHDNRMEKEQGR
jgi:CRISPR-associated protein (TIGR03984 family)